MTNKLIGKIVITTCINKRNFFVAISCVFFIATGIAQEKQLQWNQIQPGVWKGSVGKAAAISLLKVMDNTPQTAALKELPATKFPLLEEDIVFNITNGQTTLRFPLEEQEAIYGLGLNFKTVNQRGRILNLHMDHYGGSDNGRTHAPIPFYVSSRGYGVLIDAAQYMTVYVGTANRKGAKHPPVIKDRNTDKTWDAQPYSDAIEVNIPGEKVDVYIFAGPTPLNAVQRYNLFNGGGCLPPKWGLGFTQRVPTLYSQYDVLHEVKEFEAHNFPLDFIGLEPGWQSMAYPCTLEWDSTRFPHPKEFLNELSQKGIRSNLWFNPYLSPKAELYKKILPLSGSHTVWNGIVPDITIPQTKQLLKEHFLKNHLNIGVAAYKIDEVDGYDNWIWPDVATFPSGNSAEQMRQVYGMMWQKMTLDWFKEKNQRTYGLVRASNAGASSMPYVIYNDYYSHKDFITALINSSFIGVLWL
ncbi:MAG: TIM-barrel domain-containing protein, partial [Bacteroidota bacterium]